MFISVRKNCLPYSAGFSSLLSKTIFLTMFRTPILGSDAGSLKVLFPIFIQSFNNLIANNLANGSSLSSYILDFIPS